MDVFILGFAFVFFVIGVWLVITGVVELIEDIWKNW